MADLFADGDLHFQLARILRTHWLFDLGCDGKSNQASCACGFPDFPRVANVGQAVETFVNHVLEEMRPYLAAMQAASPTSTGEGDGLREALADIASVDHAFVEANGVDAAFEKIIDRAKAALTTTAIQAAPDEEPMLTEAETDELVARINANPNLHPVAAPEGLRDAISEAIYDFLDERFPEGAMPGGQQLFASDHLDAEFKHEAGCDEMAQFILDRLAALSAPLVTQGQWQPIETAPKDGSHIQLWHETWSAPIAAYYVSGCALPWFEATRTTRWPMEAFSHWRHLPDPPALARADAPKVGNE